MTLPIRVQLADVGPLAGVPNEIVDVAPVEGVLLVVHVHIPGVVEAGIRVGNTVVKTVGFAY